MNNNSFAYGQPATAGPNQNVNNFYYDQKPSTSGMQYSTMPMQPLNPHNQMPRNAHLMNVQRQVNLEHWLGSNPVFNWQPNGYNTPSPAPSVMSRSSAQSVGSAMSRFSQLTINTNLTVYSQMPHNYSMNNCYQSGTENMYPPGGWNQKDVDGWIVDMIRVLDSTPLWKFGNKELAYVGNMIQFLTKPRTQQAKNLPAAINCVDDKRYIQLLTAMFRSIVFIEENQNEMDPSQLKIWNQVVNKLLKYITMLYTLDLRFEQQVEEVKVPLPDGSTRKPLWVLATLLIPDREYTYYAVTLFNSLLKHGDLKRRQEKIRQVSREIPAAIPGLVRIVIPFNEYMNHLERQLALDTLGVFMRRKELMRKVLETLNFSEMLRRYFKPDGDEGVLHRIPTFLCKFSCLQRRPVAREEFKELRELFFQQFTAANGYTYICEMLVHGSPRVLTACLQFLGSHEDARIRKISCITQLVVAVLKLVGSSEVQITQPALQFLLNAVANDQQVKQAVTRANGVEILLAALRQHYQSFDSKITADYLRTAEKEIRTHGIKILNTLVRSYDHQASASENPDRLLAIQDAFKFPELPELICNWTNVELDDSRLEIIRFSRNILENVTNSQLVEPILTKTFVLDDKSEQTSMVQTFARLFVTYFIYHDQILLQLREPKRGTERQHLIYTSVHELSQLIVAICAHEAPKKTIAELFGRTNIEESLMRLFHATQDTNLHMKLLILMCSITRNRADPILSMLPSRWAQFPHFNHIMMFYQQHAQTQEMAQHLLQYPKPS